MRQERVFKNEMRPGWHANTSSHHLCWRCWKSEFLVIFARMNLCFATALAITLNLAIAHADTLTVTVTTPPPPETAGFKMGESHRPDGATLTLDSSSLRLNGKPWM